MSDLENEEKKLQELLEKLKELDDDGVNDIDDLIGFSLGDLEEEFIKEQNTKTVKFKKLDSEVKTPEYAYGLDSGFDLYSTEKMVLEPFGRALIPTGLSFDLPEGYEIQVRTKSGLAINLGLMVSNSPGTVDRGYLGEIKVPIFNTSNSTIVIEKGMKVAQAVLCPVVCGKFVRFEQSDNLGTSERGDKGFGSTGLK